MDGYGVSPTFQDDLNFHSASLKRATASDQFLYVPLAKRQQLETDGSYFGASLWDGSDCNANRAVGKYFVESNALLAFEEMPLDALVDSALDVADTDESNIAATPAYIESLMNIVQPSDDQLNYSFSEPLCMEAFGNRQPNSVASNDETRDHLPSIAAEDDMSLNESAEKAWNNDDDDSFLTELPTSIDDFQNKEYHLKLERHYSSPLVSRRQSPQHSERCLSARGSVASEGSFSHSGKLSIASNYARYDDEPLDEDDLEVAMINESFEEQQKQSLIYDCDGLKSLFYGVSSIGRGNQSDEFKNFDENGNHGTNAPFHPEHISLMTPLNATPGTEANFVPLLTPQSKSFVQKSHSNQNNMTDEDSIVPAHYANAAKLDAAAAAAASDAEYDRQLHMELEKMILGDDNEEIRRMENSMSDRKSSFLEIARASSSVLSDGLPSLPSASGSASRLFSGHPEDPFPTKFADGQIPHISSSIFSSSSSQEGFPVLPAVNKDEAPNDVDVEERMLLSESVLRSLEQDDDFEDVFEKPPETKTEPTDAKDLTGNEVKNASATSLLTTATHEQEVPESIVLLCC